MSTVCGKRDLHPASFATAAASSSRQHLQEASGSLMEVDDPSTPDAGRPSIAAAHEGGCATPPPSSESHLLRPETLASPICTIEAVIAPTIVSLQVNRDDIAVLQTGPHLLAPAAGEVAFEECAALLSFWRPLAMWTTFYSNFLGSPEGKHALPEPAGHHTVFRAPMTLWYVVAIIARLTDDALAALAAHLRTSAAHFNELVTEVQAFPQRTSDRSKIADLARQLFDVSLEPSLSTLASLVQAVRDATLAEKYAWYALPLRAGDAPWVWAIVLGVVGAHKQLVQPADSQGSLRAIERASPAYRRLPQPPTRDGTMAALATA